MKKFPIILVSVFLQLITASFYVNAEGLFSTYDETAKTDNFLCPTYISECKIICSSEGNSQPYVKSSVSSLSYSIRENDKIVITGTSLKNAPLEKSGASQSNFYGHFSKSSSCMIFGLTLTDNSHQNTP